MTELDKDFTAHSVGEAFKQCIAHMKAGFPVWEELLLRGFKLHRQLENTITVFGSFMEGLSKVSEVASKGRAGGTSDIGAGLSNLVSWHKALDFKIREMNSAFSTKLLVPLQSKVEDWKKKTSHMDREHDKEVQKAVKEIRESHKTALKTHKHLESKIKKEKTDKVGMLQYQLDHQKKEMSRLVLEAEEKERDHLNSVLLEERRWYSGFVAGFSKSLDVEVSMFGNVDKLKTILSELGETVSQPNTLPTTAKDFVDNWNIPPPHARQRRPSIHNSSHSLNSAHSLTSIGSQDSINITAPVPPPGPSLHPPISVANGVTAPPTASTSQPVPPPVAPVPPPAAPGAQYPQGNQPPDGHQHLQTQHYAQPNTQYAQPGAPPMAPAPPMPPAPPPAPPNQYAQHYAPTSAPTQYSQTPPVQYAQPVPPPPPPAPSQPSTAPSSQYAQYPPAGHPGHSQLPPPPPPNFPLAPDAYYDPQRPLVPAAPANIAYDDNFEPISVTSSMSVSPSQASLSSHQSTESGRSLSPPVGPTRSPNQNRAQLSSLQEESNSAASGPGDFQTALLSKIRQRSSSFDMNDPTNHRDTINRDAPPTLPRTTSVGSRNMVQGPRIAHKPPRGPNKPSRSSSLRISPAAGHPNHAPNATPPYNAGTGAAPPHHVINPNRHSTCSSDSDELEEESAFAKALREKKQRMLQSSGSGLATDSRR